MHGEKLWCKHKYKSVFVIIIEYILDWILDSNGNNREKKKTPKKIAKTQHKNKKNYKKNIQKQLNKWNNNRNNNRRNNNKIIYKIFTKLQYLYITSKIKFYFYSIYTRTSILPHYYVYTHNNTLALVKLLLSNNLTPSLIRSWL